jgi:hypothetical protein
MIDYDERQAPMVQFLPPGGAMHRPCAILTRASPAGNLRIAIEPANP